MTSTEPEAVALAVIDLARDGQFAEIRDRFAAGLRPLVAAATLQAAWAAEVAELGPVTSIGAPSSEQAGAGAVVISVPVRLERGELALVVSVTDRPRRHHRQEQATQGPRLGTGQPGRRRHALRQGDPCPPGSQPAIDAMTALAERVDSPGLSAETPDGELPFAAPAPYWPDLRGYDPVATAAALGKRMLMCQGGRDYQATVADDLSRWQAGLGGRPDVTIRIYPADNHFFFPGTGPSSPAELAAPQHLDRELAADVSDWLTGKGL